MRKRGEWSKLDDDDYFQLIIYFYLFFLLYRRLCFTKKENKITFVKSRERTMRTDYGSVNKNPGET